MIVEAVGDVVAPVGEVVDVRVAVDYRRHGPPGLHDPYASPRSSEATVVPVTPTSPVKVPQLPGKIILGKPGPGKVAVTPLEEVRVTVTFVPQFPEIAIVAGMGAPVQIIV